jgi:hypothetical protein
MTGRLPAATLGMVVAMVSASCAAPERGGAETFSDATTGVQVEMPPVWHDRLSVRVLPGGMDPSGTSALRSIYFNYMPKDSSIASQTLLGVIVYRKSDWEPLAAEPGPPMGDVLLEKDSTVIIASLPQSNPFSTGTPDALAFDSLRVDLAHAKGMVRKKDN